MFQVGRAPDMQYFWAPKDPVLDMSPVLSSVATLVQPLGYGILPYHQAILRNEIPAHFRMLLQFLVPSKDYLSFDETKRNARHGTALFTGIFMKKV